MLTGKAFEDWLATAAPADIPDFLDLPRQAIGGNLCQNDILVLRRLREQARGTAGTVTLSELSALQRLHQQGIVSRQTVGASVYYAMTPTAHAILRANTSFRGVGYSRAAISKGESDELA